MKEILLGKNSETVLSGESILQKGISDSFCGHIFFRKYSTAVGCFQEDLQTEIPRKFKCIFHTVFILISAHLWDVFPIGLDIVTQGSGITVISICQSFVTLRVILFLPG